MDIAIAVIVGTIPVVLLLGVVIFTLGLVVMGFAAPFAAVAGSLVGHRRHPTVTRKPAAGGLGRPALHH